MRALMECVCGFVGEDAETFDRHMASHNGPDVPGCLDWWQSPVWRKRGPADGILRLVEQGAITRGKAIELIRDRVAGETWSSLPPAPWDKLNWSDDAGPILPALEQRAQAAKSAEQPKASPPSEPHS